MTSERLGEQSRGAGTPSDYVAHRHWCNAWCRWSLHAGLTFARSPEDISDVIRADCEGALIYSPPGNFCLYFNCIPSFWKSTNGYVDKCHDGTYSHSGGRQGACSYHGGEMRPLYA